MSRYIDADDITKRIQSRIGYFEMYYPNDTKNIYELQNCLELINETPTAEVKSMQVELTEELKEEIKQTLIQSNKDLSYALEDYDRGWLGGNLEIVRILEKHYGKIIDDDEIMRESEEEE